MRFDHDHPDNINSLSLGDGRSIRTSLPITWELVIFYKCEVQDQTISATLLVGEDGDMLKFPTKYSD